MGVYNSKLTAWNCSKVFVQLFFSWINYLQRQNFYYLVKWNTNNKSKNKRWYFCREEEISIGALHCIVDIWLHIRGTIQPVDWDTRSLSQCFSPQPTENIREKNVKLYSWAKPAPVIWELAGSVRRFLDNAKIYYTSLTKGQNKLKLVQTNSD